MTQYAGLDVAVKETAICVVDAAGDLVWLGVEAMKVVHPGRGCEAGVVIPTNPEPRPRMNIHKHARMTVHGRALLVHRVAVEDWRVADAAGAAGISTRTAYKWLARHRAGGAAALKLQANKTDRNDARGLAQLVRCGWYDAVPMKSIATHRVRAIVVARDQFVRMCTALINKIRGLAKTFGVIIGSGKGGSFDRAVRRAMPPDPLVRDLLESLLETLAVLRERRRRFDRQLGRIARQSESCRLLMTVPGVGPITAVAFAAAIEDPSRFRRASDVGAYLGLTPTRYQSGEVDIGGRISKCGDRLTRRLLFEAASVILFRTRELFGLRVWAEQLAARSG